MQRLEEAAPQALFFLSLKRDTMKVSQTNGVRWRSIALGLLLIPVNCYWIVQKQTWACLGPPDTLSLFYNVILILLVLISSISSTVELGSTERQRHSSSG